MKKSILFLLLTGFVFSYTSAQDETESYPVTAFESNYIVDDQTTMVFDKKTLGFAIQHKFGTIDNGISDLWGIYGAGTNIRMGLDYVPIKNLQIGAGVTKNKMYTDLNAKYSILQQTSDNKIPVGVAIYGVLAIDGREESAFGTAKTHQPGEGSAEYSITFTDRWSYFSQLMVSRKFGEALAVQGGVSFTHYNMVKADEDHDLIGLHGLAKVKISPQSSLTFNYNAPLKIQSISEQTEVPDYTPSVALGWQISTYTHAFQIYLSNAPGMLPMDNMMYNRAKFNKQGIAIGFTITRLWAF
ncbi:hypothetical protein MASR2M47_31430 [Draconibacterium sp.]|jgi:hypothetical protein